MITDYFERAQTPGFNRSDLRTKHAGPGRPIDQTVRCFKALGEGLVLDVAVSQICHIP